MNECFCLCSTRQGGDGERIEREFLTDSSEIPFALLSPKKREDRRRTINKNLSLPFTFPPAMVV